MNYIASAYCLWEALQSQHELPVDKSKLQLFEDEDDVAAETTPILSPLTASNSVWFDHRTINLKADNAQHNGLHN